MRRATTADIPLLLGLMTEFYSEAGYELEQKRASEAFRCLLNDESLGSIWIIEKLADAAGYLVLTVKFAMEYAGRVGCLDDLYVRSAFRNSGLASAALLELRSVCEATGIRALTVEVAFDNGPAQKVYRRAGFTEAANRQLLSLALAAPAHIV
jgi:ribosomal protein S18 acetylase RimI-like enzyme